MVTKPLQALQASAARERWVAEEEVEEKESDGAVMRIVTLKHANIHGKRGKQVAHTYTHTHTHKR